MEEAGKVTIMDLPDEVLVHLFEGHLGLKDWITLIKTGKFLQRIVEELVPSFKYARCCVLSFLRNKGATHVSLPSSLSSEPEKYQFFDNALSCDNFVIGKVDFCYRSNIPRAFGMDSNSVPQILKTDMMDEKRKELLASFNYPLLKNEEDIWWLPNFDRTAIPKDAKRFESWKDCYQQHLKACMDLDELLESLKAKPYYPPIDMVRFLCEKVTKIFAAEPNVIPLKPPVVVVGDTHGHWANTIEIFRLAGWPGEKDYLFLGDYVNRGKYSIPLILLLFALKLKFPQRVHLLRGSAESQSVCTSQGLLIESRRKYGNDASVFEAICQTFTAMPVAALIGEKLFAMHGGLSPCIDHLNEIQILDRAIEQPLDGPICDLLWSDPEDIDGWCISPRGAGFIWGSTITSNFVKGNNLKFILRTHQLVMEGFVWTHEHQVLTIFSAAEYCYTYGNMGAIAIVSESFEPELIAYLSVDEFEES